MGEKMVTATVSVLLAIIGVAIVAMLVSKQAQTSSVISAGGSAFGGSLRCALSPILGGGCNTTPFVSSNINFGQ